jgi:hypothetical protein
VAMDLNCCTNDWAGSRVSWMFRFQVKRWPCNEHTARSSDHSITMVR